MKTGHTNLPLHYGKAPRWLFDRMRKLAYQIILTIVEDYGSGEIVERMSDPYWFHAFGCVLGFDWHSSGLTTTVCGAVKEAVRGLEREAGLYVAGGKGAASRKTPGEIERLVEEKIPCLDSKKLVYSSRMSAKVDNACLQDGYQLYHHTFIFSEQGQWAVVQQGMNPSTGWARRYHWLSTEFEDFVCEPEKAICCDHRAKVLNMIAGESEDARGAASYLAVQKPEKVLTEIGRVRNLSLPREHALFFNDLKKESLKKVLLSTYEIKPKGFEELLSIQGVGPKTIRALALLSELIYNAKVSRKDPVKYSFAHGGKDGHPYRIEKQQYDRSIEILQKALTEARIGRYEKRDAFRRLSNFY